MSHDVISMPLPDAAARRAIREDLDANLLVEAGAGSGKTTELVNRMVALIASGAATVDQIAAVTFTRKSAGELRERFQARLERELAEHSEGEHSEGEHSEGEGAEGEAAEGEGADDASEGGEGVRAPADDEVRPRLLAAVDDLERAFIGTIHAFCARLLRERPLDIGLDPGFEEIPVEERMAYQRRFWDAFLERTVREGDARLEELNASGLRAAQLLGLFQRLVENPDVAFPADEADAPSRTEVDRVRRELREITDRGMELMPERQPEPEWDSLQKKIRTLAFTRDVTGWTSTADFFEALELICKDGPRGHKPVQKRWKEKGTAKAFGERVDAFSVGPDAPGNQALTRWYAHRYALALAFAKQAADDFAEHRLRTARLDFQDLLALTARLLREVPRARADLGRRYPRLLVDEFQDTDPLQAEIMLLLASDTPGKEAELGESDDGGGDPGEIVQPDDDDPTAGATDAEAPAGDFHDTPAAVDWRTAVPRPGALFVVGDPKQSIYRFRRADILLYEQVKRRFADFGRVVELTSNFRSRPPIGDLVNQHFAGPAFFPAEASAEQARFEMLNTRPRADEVPAEGVFWYPLQPAATSRGSVTDDDAKRLAAWIGRRIEAGERRPGDFLVLTRTKHFLSSYARELEARGIPVQVTGAGVGVEEELHELMALLACLIDPGDPVKVVTVLVGLFFGLDLEALTEHRLAGGYLDVDRPGERGHPEVVEALRVLHRWWRASTVEPADVVVARLVAELGLMPFAAAGDLGSLRAGALAYAMDIVRSATLAGDASLPGALEAFAAALELAEAEAPLEPGRSDVVRLMNVHQSKGLEGTVVVLADPSTHSSFPADFHVERDEEGAAVGHLVVTEPRSGYGGPRILARPRAWGEKERVEARFQEAEDVRLLYVAATRARDELVIARWPDRPDGSPWAVLDPWVTAHAQELALELEAPGEPEVLELAADEARARTDRSGERLQRASEPTYRYLTVTDVAKGDGGDAGNVGAAGDTGAAGVQGAASSREPPPRSDFKGYSWGSAVHAALAAAAHDPGETVLRALCRDLLVDHGRPLDDHGEPVELDELVELLTAVRTSELWRRAERAERRMVEVPFAAPGMTRPAPTAPTEVEVSTEPTRERRQLDLFGAPDPPIPGKAGNPDPGPEAVPSVLEGVVDLAFREPDGWVIADYKTDVGTDPAFPTRRLGYRRQVELYARAWARLTGEPVKERVLFFTTKGTIESW